jgi:hypothetical protein
MMTNTSLEVNAFITRMKIPFYILVGLIIAVQVIRMTLVQALGLAILSLVNGKILLMFFSLLKLLFLISFSDLGTSCQRICGDILLCRWG